MWPLTKSKLSVGNLFQRLPKMLDFQRLPIAETAQGAAHSMQNTAMCRLLSGLATLLANGELGLDRLLVTKVDRGSFKIRGVAMRHEASRRVVLRRRRRRRRSGGRPALMPTPEKIVVLAARPGSSKDPVSVGRCPLCSPAQVFRLAASCLVFKSSWRSSINSALPKKALPRVHHAKCLHELFPGGSVSSVRVVKRDRERSVPFPSMHFRRRSVG